MRRGHRGSALPFAVAVLGMVVLTGTGLGVVAAMYVDHRRAETAADLAALAGASALQDGGSPCAAARRIAERNGATISVCTIDADDVVVALSVPGPHWLGQQRDLQAGARAGP